MRLKELALHLGLSQTTVSRALNGYPEVNEETRRRVLDAARRHGYQPNANARRLATGRAGAIGIVLPTDRNMLLDPHYMEFQAGLGETLLADEIDIVLSPTRGSDEMATYQRMAVGSRVDGVVLSSPLIADDRVRVLTELGLPFVLHGRSEIELPYSFVDIDNDNAFERLTNLLLDYGHRRIVVINGLAQFRYVAARAASFRRAFAARGLTPPPDAIEFVSMTEATGYETAMRRLKDAERPTAFLCGSVFQARGVYRAIAENGLSVGGDVSVICHDDGVRGCGAADLTPPLTATATSIRGAGEELALILIEMIEGRATQPVRKILPFELILRDSVGLAGPHGRRSGKAADPEGPNRALP